MSNPGFNVDTHLFRELGELLVGRDSTALAELVKNAYDADASLVQITGVGLSKGDSHSYIQIKDDGNGMSPDEFERGFLTIAGRIKDSGIRLSPRFKRKYTGQKGIGRLAAHKLARRLEIISVPRAIGNVKSGALVGVKATIDWETIEKEAKTFDDIRDTNAIVIEELEVGPGDSPGTTITLKHLKRKWNDRQIRDFGLEIGLLLPSPALLEDPSTHFLKGQSLLGKIDSTKMANSDPEFRIEPMGEFEVGDDFGHVSVAKAHFVLEIDAKKSEVKYRISPLEGASTHYKYAEIGGPQSFEAKPKKILDASLTDSTIPEFTARIIVRAGAKSGSNSGWSARAAGVSVFMESFRVLPYGEASDDWLHIKADYTNLRSTTAASELLKGFDFLDETAGERLVLLPVSAFFGGVFLTEDNAKNLQMLVNREGFTPSPEFDYITKVIKVGIAAMNRVRARINNQNEDLKELQKADSSTAQHPKPSPADLRQELANLVESGQSKVKAARLDLAANKPDQAIKKVEAAFVDFNEFRQHAGTMLDSTWQLPVLASLGLQMASFVHEMNGLLGHIATMKSALDHLKKICRMDVEATDVIHELAASMVTVNEVIHRQAAYLTDVTSPDRRRRASRQKIDERLESALKIVTVPLQELGIRISNDLPANLSSSEAMYPAELTMVFTNLLTNAIKACGEGGEIFIHSKVDGNNINIWIENTGVEVNVEDSERWFDALESTTIETTNPVLGQGMGMGLPITRHLVELRRGSIRFVTPTEGFSTCIEVTYPK